MLQSMVERYHVTEIYEIHMLSMEVHELGESIDKEFELVDESLQEVLAEFRSVLSNPTELPP